jgi:BirA family biotin operon repressor/biotin-[acetyl-CoA-carboxylase] ligase
MIIGTKYIYHEYLSSTNSYAAGLVKNNAAREGTIVYTNFQTAGRGQAGNSWESEEGKNLLISLILFPSMIIPEEQFIMSKTVSLGICDFLLQNTANVSIKWPNDICINNDKIAGILIESSILMNEIESMIVGIGLNINQRIFKSDAPNPVSLSMITGKEHDLEECLKSLANCLDTRYKQLTTEGRNGIDSEYTAKLYRRGEWCTYSDSAGQFEGRIISVNPDGRLQIEDHRGEIKEYGFKEIEFL